MRLIKLEADGDFSLTDDIIGDVPPYAILSHTWRIDGDEVTLKDLLEGTAMSKAGYSKIHFCKKQAASDGLQYVWVDTCCIDKSSSAELQEAINSMFHWYRDATRCYVYLSDVSVGDCYKNNMTSQSSWELAFQASRWFTRGWTLQELLAPASVEFFSQEGKRLGDKKSLEHQVHKITGISIQALQGSPLSCFSISERFSWVKTRETKRKEDGAYSLLGIFNINMPLIYGEGMERAFIRLQKEIKESSKDEWPILPRRSGKEDDSQIRASSSSNGPAFYKSGPSKYELLHQRQDEASDIFGDVITRFRNSLGPNEKEIFKEFSSSGEMIVDLHSWCKDIRNRRKLTGLYRKIERFADFLEPIFRIINIYVPNRPEFAGATWGAMRLVFLLGLKHMTYLEKVVLMIQKIGESLPPYEEYFKLFISRNEKTESETGPALPTETRHYRLYKAVSYVYADIVQFCQESCKIFETKRSVHHKPPVISESSWKPFDARFSSLLDRLRFHQGVFGCEMQLEESKYRELQYEKRARQPDLDEQVLQQILQQVKDLRLSNDLLESKITSLLENFENKLRENEFNKGVSKEIEQKDAEAINSKASDIEEWTDAPEYMRELEKAKSTRLPETGEYLLNDSVYKKWKFGKPSRHEEASVIVAPEIPRILFIKGKPGYGKTVLSSLLIEDLRTFTMSLAADISNYGSVFFYHFASERRDYCEPYYALRAVLVQLVHRFRSCKDIIDRISVLMESDNGGKLKASDEEIFAALSLLLEGLEHTFLVFDGLDECGEHTTFLELIRELCASTSTRVLLLGRPNVELPIQFQNLSLYLDQSSNLQDIKLYLEPQILLLQDRGLIPDETSLEAAVVTLASRAEGMFLWAWLMTQYLNCRALSPKERLEAIFEAADVEGLHDVYGKILRVLDQGYVKERASVRKIFGLMAIAFRPLLVTELRIAVAISPGKSTETSSLIVEFEESLPIICGALVEIQSDRTVRFIHSSFRTFLASASGPAHGSSFSIDERTTHVLCSTICLSYLIYDLPSSPLCQTSNANIEDLKVSFPFIEYALQWVKHAASGFQANDINSIPLELKIQDNFYTILAKFISRPLTITVWIEASGMFCMKPSLKVLTALRSSQDFHLVSASPFNTGNIAVTLLEELATDLERLDTEWGHLLKQDPSAIWGPSITAFARSPFWFETKNTVVSSMLPTEATGSFRSCSPERPVLIQSQISGDSRELGIVLVLPSKSYLIVAESVLGAPTRKSRQDSPLLSDEEKQRLAKVCSFEWKVRYQRRNIRNEEILMDFEVELPDRQIFQMLQQCISSKTPHRFPFPVAFSHDLNRLIVLRCVLIIRLVPIVESGAVVPQCRLQSLEREVHPEPDANSSERTAFYSVFSPDAKALAFVFGRLQPNAIDCRRVRVWSEAAVGDWPSYQYKGEAMTSRLSWQGEASRDQFAFHPYLPLMVFTEWNATVAWMFNSVRPLKIYTIITRPVTSLSFSKNGFFLLYRSVEPGNVGREQESRTFARSQRILDYGYESGHAYYNHPPGIDLAPSFDSPSSFQAHDIFNLHPFVTERLIDLRHDVPHEISALFFNQSHRALRATNSSLNRNDGWTDVTSSTQNEKLSQALQVSPLQSTSSTSTLINHQTTQQATHSGVVIAGSRLLAHLPRLQQGEETYISLLPCEENDKWVRMVWNKAAQNTYSIYDYQTPHLPSIIYRQQGTIEKNDNDLQTAKRPRLVL